MDICDRYVDVFDLFDLFEKSLDPTEIEKPALPQMVIDASCGDLQFLVDESLLETGPAGQLGRRPQKQSWMLPHDLEGDYWQVAVELQGGARRTWLGPVS